MGLLGSPATLALELMLELVVAVLHDVSTPLFAGSRAFSARTSSSRRLFWLMSLMADLPLARVPPPKER